MTMEGDDLASLRSCDSNATRQRHFADRFAHYRQALRAMAEMRLDQLLRGRVDPSDVVQETYMEAAARLDEYLEAAPMPLLLWLRLLTRQRLHTLYREHVEAAKRDVRREIPLARDGLPLASSEVMATYLTRALTSPSETARREETKQRVRQALDSMDTIDREILVLRHFEDLSCADAARELEIKPAAARQRYFRALDRFKQVLAAARGKGSDSW